ncbi:iron-siderophore ABC transporter substrate-binding protein [Ruicaihuangia caeni]|uniref:Iron-siderophore ABC transporter substrate-binding protein n=1 Tax=Ruicaihuangia caeni TaxID=3042517 RepID=A0AAW6T6A7_9MICO|nr:iron-siderophore ABC transporter substrate-binding protein [Klugiella sp. YN-L-19]MDI2097688.1 iron-siderophore ABC transporter substrate-binding protein [Klugiella sp. YN-L-19]
MSRRLIRAAVLAAASALLLAGCSAGAPATGESSGPSRDAGAIEVEHAFGTTTIEGAPERVVTLGWGSTDAAIALGVVPVAIEQQSYGANADGYLPWVEEAVKDADAELPTLIPEQVDAPAYEAIAAAEPDLIIAAYSGITEEQYALLSQIAPTVAYPDAPWATPWRDVIGIVGKSLGLESEAAALLDDIDATIADAAETHPQLNGKTVAAVWDVGGTFYVYKSADARVQFLFDLGLENAPAVDELASGDSTFYYTLSYEQLDRLDSDVLVAFADAEADAERFLQQPYAALIPAVNEGHVASVTGTELIAAVSPPTALSLTWGLDDYLEALTAAVD